MSVEIDDELEVENPEESEETTIIGPVTGEPATEEDIP